MFKENKTKTKWKIKLKHDAYQERVWPGTSISAKTFTPFRSAYLQLIYLISEFYNLKAITHAQLMI